MVESRERPIQFPAQLGNAMMRNLTGQPQHHFLTVNCRTGFYDPESRGRSHVGTYPEHMQGFVRQRCFQRWLQQLLQALLSKQARPGQSPSTVHALMWCNKGTHRSVSASLVLQHVADTLQIPPSSCKHIVQYLKCVAATCSTNVLSTHTTMGSNSK